MVSMKFGLYIYNRCNPQNHLQSDAYIDSYMGSNIMKSYYSDELLSLINKSSYSDSMMHSSLILLKDVYYFLMRLKEGVTQDVERERELNDAESNNVKTMDTNNSRFYKFFKDIQSHDDMQEKIKTYNETFRHIYTVGKSSSNKLFLKELKTMMNSGYVDLINDYDHSINNHLKLIN